MEITLPAEHRAGDTFNLPVTLALYPADTWTLTLKIVNELKLYTITGTANGEDHSLTASHTVTAKWAPGKYKAFLRVDNGTESYTLTVSVFEILTDIIIGFDIRSHVEFMVEAIEAHLQNKATDAQLDVLTAGFNGRNIQLMPMTELLLVRDKYKAELKMLKKTEAIKNGLSTSNTVYTRLRV